MYTNEYLYESHYLWKILDLKSRFFNFNDAILSTLQMNFNHSNCCHHLKMYTADDISLMACASLTFDCVDLYLNAYLTLIDCGIESLFNDVIIALN